MSAPSRYKTYPEVAGGKEENTLPEMRAPLPAEIEIQPDMPALHN